MKNLAIFCLIILFALLSGCASKTVQEKTVAPGQLSEDEINGTDTLGPGATQGFSADKEFADLKKAVKKLAKNQKYIKGEQDMLKERVGNIEKYTRKINEAENLAKVRRGPRALPNIEVTEDRIAGFESGDDSLSDQMKEKILAMAQFIKKKNKEGQEKGYHLKVLIEGWADGSGGAWLNHQLSLSRASMARHYLKSILTDEEIEQITISVRGRGESSKKTGQNYRYVVFRLRYL